MNYYIQGNKDNADKIKAAFEAKGCVMHTGIQCDLSDMIYFSLNGKVGGIKLRNLDLFKTHPDYKELELRLEPKFKDGDEVVFGTLHETIAVVLINEQRYLCETCREILFKEQDRWNLAPKPHYDIKNFHVGMPVLVRADNNCRWDYSVFSRITGNEDWPFAVCNGVSFTQCIPFEGNEYLLGTTDMCDERFINW